MVLKLDREYQRIQYWNRWHDLTRRRPASSECTGSARACHCCYASDRRPAQPESEAATARPPGTADWPSLPGPARSGLAPAEQPSADTVPPRCCRAATDHMALLATAAAVGMLLAPVTRAMHNGAAQTPPLGSVPHADRTHRPHPQIHRTRCCRRCCRMQVAKLEQLPDGLQRLAHPAGGDGHGSERPQGRRLYVAAGGRPWLHALPDWQPDEGVSYAAVHSTSQVER